MSNSAVFLIGGHDLEMAEIINILTSQNLKFYDKNLSWNNANLSDYADVLDNENSFIAIELKKDLEHPNVKFIDHHNERSNEPSSIEQVADLLKITLTREQQLIAANDKGYIPAMEALDATKEEINDIRRRDRQAQGIVNNDELIGERSIKENLIEKDGILIVKSLTTRFATITDKLFPYKCLLIYNENALNYYGEGVELLVECFDELIKEKKAYYGGKGNRFFGLSEDGIQWLGGINLAYEKVLQMLTINKDNIEDKKQEDDKSFTTERVLTTESSLFSYHIFIFPFKWENRSTSKKTRLGEYNLLEIRPKGSSNWINLPKPITIDYATELYNEKNFFYEFVHPVLYDEGGTLDPIVLHYERKEAYDRNDLFYEIDVIANNISNRYKLNLKSIGLNLYSTGTGSLVFYIENNNYAQFIDILRINQFGRRIFPPFLDKTTGVLGTKLTELPNHIALIGLNGSEHRYFENFDGYTEKTEWKPAKFIESLIDDFNENIEIRPVTDDRMHVLCRYENNELSHQVSNDFDKNGDFKNKWYRFLFIDGGEYPMCQNERMKDELINNHSYKRWTNYGTLFGVARYSFVLVTSKEVPQFIKDHFRTMYARMVELTLIQRASILRFSEEVTELSKLKQEKSYDLTERISCLYKEYIRFVNQVYFREVTAQEQGIELYNLLQEKMKIAEQVKDLDHEIEELHNYANLIEQKAQDKRIAKITILGAIFLPATFLVGLFGINTLPEPSKIPKYLLSGEPFPPFWISLAFISVATAILIVIIDLIGKFGIIFKINRNKNL